MKYVHPKCLCCVKIFDTEDLFLKNGQNVKVSRITGLTERPSKDRIGRFQTLLRESVKFSNYQKLFWSRDSA